MRYVRQEKKTSWGDQQLVSGVNCRPESVYDDFLQTKLLYRMEKGRMFYHLLQSLSKGEPVDPATARAAALKLAECMRYARSRDEFILLMRNAGYDIHQQDPSEGTGAENRFRQSAQEN